MKRLLLFFLLLPSVVVGHTQSVIVSHSIEMMSDVKASEQFNSVFGQWINNEVDNPFPYVVIQMNLVGNEQDINQAKVRLGLDVGSMYPILAIDRSQHNKILFLIPKGVRNIYILCGDGCEKQLLHSGVLIENRAYTCTVEYNSSQTMSDESMNEMKNQMDSIQQILQDMQGVMNQNLGNNPVNAKKQNNSNPKKKVDLSSMPDEIEMNVNGVVFKMIKVTGSTFAMGYDKGMDDTRPVHDVTLSDYYIGETEVTQELWKAVMGNNPSDFKGKEKPVNRVSWYDCQKFLTKLYEMTGKTFTLPTEAQWEYAARGGNKSHGYKYSGSDKINEVGWFWRNSGKKYVMDPLENADQLDKNKCKTHPVKQKQPNELGLYDMAGNVWEWCSDWYGMYPYLPQTDPKGPSESLWKIIRGGAYSEEITGCTVYVRGFGSPISQGTNVGLRLVYMP